VQERHHSGFEPKQLTTDERRALARRARYGNATVLAGAGLALLALFVVGCPEPGDLANPEAWPAPTPAGGSASTGGSAPTAGTATGGTSPSASCEVACVNDLFQNGSLCVACHMSPNPLGGIDLKSPDYTSRLKNQPVTFPTVTDKSSCPTGAKLIDTATPADSWLLKKIHGQQGACGSSMPVGGTLTADQTTCLEMYVACVAGGT
jgi:hypothetical protein